MPTTPDTFPGPLEEEELQLQEQSSDPTIEGAIRNVLGVFKAKDKDGVFSLRTGGGGISEAEHDALDDLVHWLAETHYQEIVRSGGRVSNVINWTDSGKTTKVRELALTRSPGPQVSQVDLIQYNGSGTEIQRLTGVIARTSGKVSSIQWTETGS